MAYWRNQFFLSKTNNASFISSIFDLSGNIDSVTNVFSDRIARYIDIASINQQTNNFDGSAGLVFNSSANIFSFNDTFGFVSRQMSLSSNFVGDSSFLLTNITKQSNIQSSIEAISSINGYGSNNFFVSSFINSTTNVFGQIYTVINLFGDAISVSNFNAGVQYYLGLVGDAGTTSSIPPSKVILNLFSSASILPISNLNSNASLTQFIIGNALSSSVVQNINVNKNVYLNGQFLQLSSTFANSNKQSSISSQVNSSSNLNNTINYKIIGISGFAHSESDAFIYIIPIVEIGALPIYSSSNVFSENSFLRYSAYESEVYITLNMGGTVQISNSVYIDGEISLWSISE